MSTNVSSPNSGAYSTATAKIPFTNSAMSAPVNTCCLLFSVEIPNISMNKKSSNSCSFSFNILIPNNVSTAS